MKRCPSSPAAPAPRRAKLWRGTSGSGSPRARLPALHRTRGGDRRGPLPPPSTSAETEGARRGPVPGGSALGGGGPPRGGPPAADGLRVLFKELFARGERYNETGGIHAAALTDGEGLRFHAEDIGRHNAVDKAIGAAVLAREPVTGRGLLVTGRISAELAYKGARAGLAWIATPSVPSTLALTIAPRAGMILVGRAVSGAPHLHRPEA